MSIPRWLGWILYVGMWVGGAAVGVGVLAVVLFVLAFAVKLGWRLAG